MKPIATRPPPQQLRARLDSNGVLDLLTDVFLAETLATHLPPHRQRLYPPIETLAMLASQTLSDDRSCQCVVDECIVRSPATPRPRAVRRARTARRVSAFPFRSFASSAMSSRTARATSRASKARFANMTHC